MACRAASLKLSAPEQHYRKNTYLLYSDANAFDPLTRTSILSVPRHWRARRRPRLKLARLVLPSWRGKQQSAIDCASQAKGRRDVSPQIGDNHLLVYDSLRPRLGSMGRQSDIHDAIREPKCGCVFVKDKWCMRRITNREPSNREPSNFFGVERGEDCPLCLMRFKLRFHLRLSKK